MDRVKSGNVTGSRVALNRDGDKNVLLLQAEISTPDDVQTVELMSQTGEESRPPAGSRIIVLSAGNAWKIAVTSDDRIEPVVSAGEKRIYSTNEDGDTVRANIFLKNNGNIEISNARASILMNAASGNIDLSTAGYTIIDSDLTIIDNDVQVNGSITSTGDITCSDVIFAGINGSTHVHPISYGSSAPGPTGPPAVPI